MGRCVTAFSVARCTMGVAPTQLVITPEKRVVVGVLPLASILDFKPFMNVAPFVLCRSPANPAVAAIIASSFGSVTVGPCVPCMCVRGCQAIPRRWLVLRQLLLKARK